MWNFYSRCWRCCWLHVTCDAYSWCRAGWVYSAVYSGPGNVASAGGVSWTRSSHYTPRPLSATQRGAPHSRDRVREKQDYHSVPVKLSQHRQSWSVSDKSEEFQPATKNIKHYSLQRGSSCKLHEWAKKSIQEFASDVLALEFDEKRGENLPT